MQTERPPRGGLSNFNWQFNHAAIGAAFRFLRQPRTASALSPVVKRGRAAGRGVKPYDRLSKKTPSPIWVPARVTEVKGKSEIKPAKREESKLVVVPE